MQLIDFFSIIIIFLLGLYGLFKGIIKIVFYLVGFISGLVVAIFYYNFLGLILRDIFESLRTNILVSNLLAFLILFLIIFFIFVMLSMVLKKFFTIIRLKWLDNLGGFILGILLGILIVSLTVKFLILVPFVDQTMILESFSYKFILPCFNSLYEILKGL